MTPKSPESFVYTDEGDENIVTLRLAEEVISAVVFGFEIPMVRLHATGEKEEFD
jgi:hypothetical protein